MMLKTVIYIYIILAVSINSAHATTITFQTIDYGIYESLIFDDLTITNLNGIFDVTSANPGDPIYNNCITSTYQHPNEISPFLVTFNESVGIVNDFSIGVGDYNLDSDDTFLEILDSTMTRLGFMYYENSANKFGGSYLSLHSDSPIKFAKFWSSGQQPGSVLWDNLTYTAVPTPVPLPSTLILLMSGIPFLLYKRFRE